MKRIVASTIAGICAIVLSQVNARPILAQSAKATFQQRPFPGYCPDAETASGIASIIARRFLGKHLAAKYTFDATDSGETWTAKGRLKTLPELGETSPDITFVIAKDNARIVKAVLRAG
jgi:hypothetical protein